MLAGRLVLASALATLFIIGSIGHTLAQSTGCINTSPPCLQTESAVPIGEASLAVGPVSTTVALPATGVNLTVLVQNIGTRPAHYLLGNSAVVATTADRVVSPGETLALPIGVSNTNIAGITDAGETLLRVRVMVGVPVVVIVSGPPVSTSRSLYQLGGTVATGGTFQTVMAGNQARTDCMVQNTGSHVGYVHWGPETPTLLNSMQLATGSIFRCNSAGVVQKSAIQYTTGTTLDPLVYSEDQ